MASWSFWGMTNIKFHLISRKILPVLFFARVLSEKSLSFSWAPLYLPSWLLELYGVCGFFRKSSNCWKRLENLRWNQFILVIYINSVKAIIYCTRTNNKYNCCNAKNYLWIIGLYLISITWNLTNTV